MFLAIAEVEILGCTALNLVDNPNTDLLEEGEINASLLPNEFDANLFPNPAEEIINVNFQTPTDNNLKVLITDMKGVEAYRNQFYAYAGKHSFQLDISKYPKGNYIIYLQHGALSKVIRFVKL